jgi:hypothetical protein
VLDLLVTEDDVEPARFDRTVATPAGLFGVGDVALVHRGHSQSTSVRSNGSGWSALCAGALAQTGSDVRSRRPNATASIRSTIPSATRCRTMASLLFEQMAALDRLGAEEPHAEVSALCVTIALVGGVDVAELEDHLVGRLGAG